MHHLLGQENTWCEEVYITWSGAVITTTLRIRLQHDEMMHSSHIVRRSVVTSGCTVQDWLGCGSRTIERGAAPEAQVTGLNPSSSYLFRLYVVQDDGTEIGPGPELAFDTEGDEEQVLLCSVLSFACLPLSLSVIAATGCGWT